MPEREHPRPPRLAAWLVRLAVPGRWREALLGDLVEDFHAALDAGMPIGDARRAFWRAACRSTLDAGRARRWLLASTIDHDADTTARPTGDPLMIALAHDLRLAWRSLRRAPGFTTVVVLTLALGIGCLAAFWSLFDGVLLQPLPYAEPDRLVQVWGHHVERPDGRWNSSYPDVVDLRDGATAFEQITVYQPTHANLVRDGAPPERLATTFVSANFFRLLGLSPTLGRELGEADERGEASPSVVLGEALWRRAFGADPEILGRVVQVDGVPRTIVGVAPADLTFPTRTELWMPVSALASIDVRGVHSLKVIGRLATGASLARADDEAATVAARLRVDHPSSKAQFDWRVEPLHESVAGFVRPRLTLVAGAATLLLLIVCANVSSLLLERAQRRGREVATRAALGASVGQLARGFFAEAAWLVAAGAVGGVAVAALGRRWLLAHGPALPRAIDPALDERTLAMILMASLAIGGLLTLVPAMQLLGRNLARRLGAGVLGTAGRRRGRWRAAFVVGQIALAVVLTLGAALLAESLRRLYAVDPGFDPRGVLTVDLEVSTPYVSDAWPDTVAFYEALIERVEGLPGVVSAAAAHHHAAEPGWSTSFTIEGEPAPEEGYEPEANFRPVTAGYFDTIGLPLLHGRPI
ncbi:MAG: ABC transporter permease, partial [Acidobacteriota bacterium]